MALSAASDAAASDEAPASASDEVPAKSKKQAKREKRQAAWASSSSAWKAKKKQQRKDAKAAKAAAEQASWQALSPDEQERRRQAAAAAHEADRARRAALAEARASAPAIHCAVDCAFDELMSGREITSLVQQLAFGYGANRKAVYPVRYHLCSLPSGSSTLGGLERIQGFPRWKHLDVSAESYATAASRLSLVPCYLTSESDQVLDELQPGHLYIIGGLVDHNRSKGLTHRQAVASGVATARLPIDENLAMSQRRSDGGHSSRGRRALLMTAAGTSPAPLGEAYSRTPQSLSECSR